MTNILVLTLILEACGACADTRTDKSFADWLFAGGHYDLALSEYFRIYYQSSFANGGHQTSVKHDIAKCYLMMGKFEEGINWCESIEDSSMSPALADLFLTHARLLMKAGRMSEAREILSRSYTVLEEDNNGYVLFLRGCTFALEWRHDDAIAQWQRIPSGNPFKKQSDIYTIICTEARQLKFLSPTKGAVLGVVPGAGYLYAGHKQTALAAAIAIGLTAWGTYASFDKGIPGLGYLTGLLTVGWYSGSIYGSFWACARWNDSQRNRLLKEINY